MYSIRYLDKSFNGEMLEILESAPITTDSLTLCFDKRPDIFRLPEIKYSPFYYLGFFQNDSLKGFAMNGYHTAMVNGKPETVFHFAGMYIKPEARAKGFGFKISDYFFRETHNKARFGYVIIMDGNKQALSLVGRHHPRFPHIPWSKIINKLHVKSIILAWPVRQDPDYGTRAATPEDIPAIVSLLNEEHKSRLFGQIWSESTFEDYLSKRPGLSISDYYLATDRSKTICGVCAAWDCSSFKQTRVIHYGRKFLPARIGHKLLEWLFGIPPLPAKGESFRDITIADYAVRDRNPKTMRALLKSVYNDYRKRGYHTIFWGSCADDPLLKAADGFFHESVISNIVLCATQPNLLEDEMINKNLPYIDIACL